MKRRSCRARTERWMRMPLADSPAAARARPVSPPCKFVTSFRVEHHPRPEPHFMSTTSPAPVPKSRTRPVEAPSAFPMDWPFVERIIRSPNARTIYLWGPPGVGKTWVAYHCNPAAREVSAVTVTEDTASQELRGHYLPRGRGEMVWHDGPVTAAMRAGARLVVNELTHGGPEVHTLLHPILEQIDTARLTLPTNETVRPAPGFQVICTDNAPPEDLPPALRDRFDSILEVREP